MAGWESERSELLEAGFLESEIEEYARSSRKEMSDAGFSAEEIDKYFGVKKPDMSGIRGFFEENLKKFRETDFKKEAQEAGDEFIGAIEAGWQMSVAGLVSRGQAPEKVLEEDAPYFARIASEAATLAGDLPAMLAGGYFGYVGGGLVGGFVGTKVPVLGNVAGAAVGANMGMGAGSNALPTALRAILMDHYEKGEFKDFRDFWSRASGIFLDTFKSAAVGGVTSGVGGLVARVAGRAGAPAIAKTAAQTTSEVATMVTVGKALEGEVPTAEDFIHAGAIVTGMHLTGLAVKSGAEKTTAKLRKIYAETGLRPHEIVERVQTDPVLRQELAADNIDIPESLKPAQEPVAVNPELAPDAAAKKIDLADPDLKTANAILEVVPETRVEVEPLPKPEVDAPAPKVTDGDGGGPNDPQSQVLERVVPGGKKSKSIDFDTFYTNAVDDLHPIKRFVQTLTGDKPIDVQDDPYSLARLTRGSYGKADQFLESSPFDFHTLENTGAKPLKQILEPFKSDLDGLRAYLVSMRAIELDGRGIESGVPLEAARQVTKSGRAKYHKAFEEIQTYQNSVLKYAKDSGILSQADYDTILSQNKAFIPFHRLIDEEGGAAGRGLNVRNPVKAIKGSDRQIIDPIESMIKNTYLMVTLAERNRVGVKMKELAESAGETGKLLMEKVPAPVKPIEVSMKEAGEGAVKAGADVDRVVEFLVEEGLDSESFTIFRANRQPLAKDEIAVFDQGKREVYRVAPEVAEAIKALDHESSSLLVKLLAAPARALRGGAVLSPDFMTRNVVRDQFTAFTLSGNGYIPVVDSLIGLGSLLKKDDSYQAWLKAGGANSAAVSIDRDYINAKIFKLNKETGIIDTAWNVIGSPIEMLRVMTEVFENSTRLGEFKKAQKAGKNAFAAAMDAREVTLDFARVGAKTRAMNMITAFWNAQVQGMDRTIRAFQERPLETTAKMTAAITIPSLLLWWANKDDDRWNEIPRWQKDLFWIVMTDDHIYRIPKPFEAGLIFGSLPERTLEHFFTDNPKAFKEFNETMVEAAVPSMLPTFAIPAIEHFANKSTFTGAPIIPKNVEGLLPEYQYTEYTTETSKALGKLIGYIPGAKDKSITSPAIVENYVRAWSGGLGMYALQIADRALSAAGALPEKVRPEMAIEEYPVIKAFMIRYPGSNAQSIRDFYERYTENQKFVATVKHLAKQGDFDAIQNELRVEENSHRMVQLNDIREALANSTKLIKMIHANPEIPPREKRQLIDATYIRMIEAAKLGNKTFDEMDKAMKGKRR